MSETLKGCAFSTYGYACGKPVAHGRFLCDECAEKKCASCGAPATHGCDFCGQFVCGMPLCDECTYGTDASKSAGSWGFLNHIHVSKPEFADKHENARLRSALASATRECEQSMQTIAGLREALEPFATFSDFATEQAEDGWAWQDHYGRERIYVWFGPSDFGLARAALKEQRNE